MARKKRQRYSRPRKNILVAAAVVLALGAGYLAYYLAHQHAISVDKARFTAAQKDVTTIANQVEVAIGPPQDRRDGGKCSYAHQKYTKGPLSCEVYSYLAYGVNGPEDVNAIVKKVDSLAVLHGNPWKFKVTTENPHQFDNGVDYSESFVVLDGLFDTETKSETFTDNQINEVCAVNYIYQNSLANLSGYPAFNISASQLLLLDINCAFGAKMPYFVLKA